MGSPSSYFRKWNEKTGYQSHDGSQGNILSSTTTPEPEINVGDGFRPTDVELATYYLKLMLLGCHFKVSNIPVIDIYEYDPWDLPYCPKLYFFCPRRSSRQTNGGFWKSTGQDRVIEDGIDGLVFKKKSLVYHKGRSKDRSNGTKWTIHEIRAILENGTTVLGDYVICTLFKNPDKKEAKVPTKSGGQPSSRMASELGHLLAEGNPNFPAPASYEGNSNSITTCSEGHGWSSSYGETGNIEGEPSFQKNFEIQYSSPFDESNSSNSVISEDVALGQQSQVSFMRYNEQSYSLNPMPESNVTPCSVAGVRLW